MLPVQGIQTDVDTVDTGFQQLGQLLGQKNAVGGQGDSLDAGDGPDGRHQLVQLGPHQGLAAGEANMGDAQGGKLFHQPGDLFIGEDGAVGQTLHARLRHAVDAAEVAAVRNGNPQIMDFPLKLVQHGGPPFQARS